MTEETLKKANELKKNLNSKDKAFDEVNAWKAEHEESNKHLSLANVGHGWITISAEKKEAILNLVWDIAKTEYEEAKKQFEDFTP
jgi:hypothetical protein